MSHKTKSCHIYRALPKAGDKSDIVRYCGGSLYLSRRDKCHPGNFPPRQLSTLATFHPGNFPAGQMSWAGNFLTGQMAPGQTGGIVGSSHIPPIVHFCIFHSIYGSKVSDIADFFLHFYYRRVKLMVIVGKSASTNVIPA